MGGPERLAARIDHHWLVLGLALAGLGLTVSAFVPVNRFSLHGMYQQRLIRTFLGASRRDRQPNAFTGFDQRDDLRVHELKDVRPLHVINTTLNAKSSTDVGRQETRGAVVLVHAVLRRQSRSRLSSGARIRV